MDTAYEAIKRRIVTLDLMPGERLDDYELASQLSISRTPVREAIFRLASEGLVDLGPKGGFAVRAIDLLGIPRLFEAHIVLSRAVARLAPVRINDAQLAMLRQAAEAVEEAIRRRDPLAITEANARFHRLEASASDNEFLRRLADSIHDQGQRLAYLCFGGQPELRGDLEEHFAQVQAHHRAIIDALASRDADTADRLAVEHVALFRRRVQAFLDGTVEDAVRPEN